MNNILVAKVLMSHLPEITDGAYKRATEIAIEVLLKDATSDYYALIDYYTTKPKWPLNNSAVSLFSYLGITQEEYEYWVLGKGRE